MAENRLWRWENICGPDGKPYLRRFVLARLPGNRRVYLHHFVGDDWARHPHDHPKAFWSIGLWGGYTEHQYIDLAVVNILKQAGVLRWRAPWVRWFPAEHIHRIMLTPGVSGAWTLVITGRQSRRWGFWRGLPVTQWVDWVTYLHKFGSRSG